MAELVDRNIILEGGLSSWDAYDLEDYIRSLPTVDAEPVRHGHWMEVNYYSHCGMKCSLCGSRISYKEYYNGNHKYCHKCGAKMDEEVKEDGK